MHVHAMVGFAWASPGQWAACKFKCRWRIYSVHSPFKGLTSGSKQGKVCCRIRSSCHDLGMSGAGKLQVATGGVSHPNYVLHT